MNHCALNQLPASTKTALFDFAQLCEGVNLNGLKCLPLDRPAKAPIGIGVKGGRKIVKEEQWI